MLPEPPSLNKNPDNHNLFHLVGYLVETGVNVEMDVQPSERS